MSTRACYRFIDPDTNDPEVVTVYKHSDGYPDGAVCWISKALEHAWPLPRFEADEFAAAFVAANKPSAKIRRMDYIAKAERETDPERKLRLLEAAKDYGPGGRYAGCVGGGIRLVNKPGCEAFKTYATDIEYLYDVTRKGNLLHIVGYSVSEQNGEWTINRIFSGSLTRMQAQYGLKYL
jgi:hypothetical protein